MNEEEITIVSLEPMRGARGWAFGPSPEEHAWRLLEGWARPQGVLEPDSGNRCFGFNNPSPTAGSPNYGYEFWVTAAAEAQPGEGVTLATYGSLCAAQGIPMRFPGGEVAWNGLNEVTDARIVARQMAWAATSANARNEAFNTANGDVFRWRRMWPQLAAWFGAEDGGFDGSGFSLQGWLSGKDEGWDALVARHRLQPIQLKRLASAWHTDLDLSRTVDCISSLAKCRRHGFADFQDSELSFVDLFDRLRRERIIP